MEDDVGGIAVHRGSRRALAGQGGAGHQHGQDLVAGSGIAFADRGAKQLKGVPDEWRLYAADASGVERARPVRTGTLLP